MNIFQIIWNAISTPNETLINISGFFLCFIEAYVSTKIIVETDDETRILKQIEKVNLLMY